MPNLTAYLVLFLWPLVGVMLFRTQPPERALIWTILGGYLFLPVRPVIDFPMVPGIDKAVVASVVALIGAFSLRRGWEDGGAVAASARRAAPARMPVHSRFARAATDRGAVAEIGGAAAGAVTGAVTGGARDGLGMRRPELAAGPARTGPPMAVERLLPKGWVLGLMLMAALGVMATTLTNADPVPAGPFFLPGMQVYVMVSVLMSLAIMLIPFLLGWRFLGGVTGQRALFMAFAIGGMLYAPLMLIEVRLSPQLNTWIYGFFPHSFAQHVRGGGFRPIVFLPHGLWVGIFMAMAILSALALWRVTPTGARPFDRLRWLVLAGGLLVVLVLAKSLGALAITLVLGAVVLFGGRRMVLLAAAGVAALVLIYPMARGAGLVPVEAVVSLAERIDAERAGSFQFRLENEDQLLAKANEKALFGWGTWGRGLIYNSWGNKTSVTDGSWIIVMNSFGWVGYLAQFGLLCIPAIRLALRRGIGPEAGFLAVVLAANLLDLIPNATLEPITWLLAGAVAGTVLSRAGGMGEVGSRMRAKGGVSLRRALR